MAYACTSALFLTILSCGVAAAQQAAGGTPIAATKLSIGAPVVVPRAMQYDITSRLNGETYRIMVSTP